MCRRFPFLSKTFFFWIRLNDSQWISSYHTRFSFNLNHIFDILPKRNYVLDEWFNISNSWNSRMSCGVIQKRWKYSSLSSSSSSFSLILMTSKYYTLKFLFSFLASLFIQNLELISIPSQLKFAQMKVFI